MPPLITGNEHFIIIAYEAQNYFNDNDDDLRYSEKLHYYPLSLKNICLTAISEKEKNYLCSRKEAFPDIFKQLSQDIHHKKDYSFLSGLKYMVSGMIQRLLFSYYVFLSLII